MEAYFQLNTLTAGEADRNGIVRYWLDNQLLIEHTDVVFRTRARPNMKFNQVILAPYIGDGAPVPQTAWIDDLFLATDRAGSSEPPPPTVPPIFGLTLSPTSATLTPGGSAAQVQTPRLDSRSGHLLCASGHLDRNRRDRHHRGSVHRGGDPPGNTS